MSTTMEQANSRFARIEGREVTVAVSSTEEAKAALKELRLKKRELALWRRGVLKERQRVRTGQARTRKSKSIWQRIVQYKSGVFGWVMGFVRRSQARRPVRKLETLEREIEHIDDLVHKIDDCILQIEGRLLNSKS